MVSNNNLRLHCYISGYLIYPTPTYLLFQKYFKHNFAFSMLKTLQLNTMFPISGKTTKQPIINS